MEFALSTNWNAYRHEIGETLIDEIRALGFEAVELGYDLRPDLVPGVLNKIKDDTIRVVSAHNFCPVPIGFLHGHPELYSLSSLDSRERRSAVVNTEKTIRFAAETGARAVVAHAGNVHMRHHSRRLIDMLEKGRRHTARYEKRLLNVQLQRERKVPPYLDAWRRSIDELFPTLVDTGISLGFENLPSWEAIPTEVEALNILDKLDSEYVGCWHDIGHGRIRQNMGLINQQFWFERLAPRLVGMHIHDVHPPANDHAIPGRGEIDFSSFAAVAYKCPVRVFEFRPGTPPEAIQEGLAFIRHLWERPA